MHLTERDKAGPIHIYFNSDVHMLMYPETRRIDISIHLMKVTDAEILFIINFIYASTIISKLILMGPNIPNYSTSFPYLFAINVCHLSVLDYTLQRKHPNALTKMGPANWISMRNDAEWQRFGRATHTWTEPIHLTHFSTEQNDISKIRSWSS